MHEVIQRNTFQIVRTTGIDFRRTAYAQFHWLKDGEEWYMGNAWFEKGEPRFQFRSGATSYEEANVIANATLMAIEWSQGTSEKDRVPPQEAAHD
jgi:hypothetical protein